MSGTQDDCMRRQESEPINNSLGNLSKFVDCILEHKGDLGEKVRSNFGLLHICERNVMQILLIVVRFIGTSKSNGLLVFAAEDRVEKEINCTKGM